jgi:hypothetical protein
MKSAFSNPFNRLGGAASAILLASSLSSNAAVVQTVQVSDNEAAFDAAVTTSLSTLATVTAPTPSAGNTLGLNNGTASGFAAGDLSVSST